MDHEQLERYLRHIGFLTSLGVASATLSTGLLWAKQGRMLRTYTATILTWSGYLFAHYFATGNFVDGLEGSDHEPDIVAKTVALLGGVVFAAGIGVMTYGLHHGTQPVAIAGGVLFFSGYVISHQMLTGELL